MQIVKNDSAVVPVPASDTGVVLQGTLVSCYRWFWCERFIVSWNMQGVWLVPKLHSAVYPHRLIL